MEFKGSKTEKNLWEAFAGESQARNKYTYFASKARAEGFNQIAAIFEETAGNEKEHAKIWFKLATEEKGIGTLIKVCKELPDVQFIFAGTGPLEETVNGIKNIKNVGFQKGEALEKLIREARFSIGNVHDVPAHDGKIP